MGISKIFNLLLVIFVFKTTLATPFESNNVNELNNEQLTQRSILERFARLENEISYLKARNYEQDQEIIQLKQKNAAFESSGSSTKDNAGVPKRGDSVDHSSMAIPAAAITVGPRTCLELAPSASGFYIVRNPAANRMKVVYCDAAANPVEEIPVGNLDIQSKGEVHFYVQRTESFSDTDTIIKFNEAKINEGNAMDVARGIFTAPVDGTYHFSFSGIRDITGTNSMKIQLLRNYTPVGLAYAANLNSFLGYSTINASLKLKAGENVALLKIGAGTLYDSADEHYTHFTGWLVQEDLTVA